MNSDTIIAERIKQKRTELKMTQRDLAKAAQTTPATISAYEKAQKKPSIDNMKSLTCLLIGYVGKNLPKRSRP